MKQKDLIPLVIAVLGGIFISVLADKYLFSNAASKNTQVDVVPSISSSFPQPPSKYFNSNAIDPTQLININPNNTTQPFSPSSTPGQ